MKGEKMEPYRFLGFSRNPDGTLIRHPAAIPTAPPGGDPEALVSSRDLPLNPSHNTWLRLYLPRGHARLPVIIFFHGGGFVLFSAATVPFHNFCHQAAFAIPAIVASVEYRLAPEHPLPAAYDDAADALLWFRNQAVTGSDPWIRDHADISRCFLAGSSSGGNIAYHAGVRALSMCLSPVRLAGLVLIQPYLGGEERTESELRFAEDKVIPLPANDLLWSLALPAGADRDHEFCNPARQPRKHAAELPRCLLTGCEQDPLVDRQRELAAVLEERAESVSQRFFEGCHGVEFFDKAKLDELLGVIREFVGETKPPPPPPPTPIPAAAL